MEGFELLDLQENKRCDKLIQLLIICIQLGGLEVSQIHTYWLNALWFHVMFFCMQY